MELDDLLAESDFVSIHAPATEGTRGMIEGPVGLMKPTAYLVSLSDAAIGRRTGPGPDPLERRIAGAALDVFETQPIAPDSPLLGLDNVV